MSQTAKANVTVQTNAKPNGQTPEAESMEGKADVVFIDERQDVNVAEVKSTTIILDANTVDAPTIAAAAKADRVLLVDSYAGSGVRVQYERIGAAIKALRLRRRWRQIDLATRASVAEGTITGVELGRRTQLHNIKKIATALAVDWEKLASGELIDNERSVDDLTDEDLWIARRYHAAPHAIKITISRLLRTTDRDLSEQFDLLDNTRQTRVRQMIEWELEEQQQAEKTGKTRKRIKG